MSHSNYNELSKLLNKYKHQIKQGDIYYHYKNPKKLYQVECIGLLERTEEPIVIYKEMFGNYLTWVRPLKEWYQEVIYTDKNQKYHWHTRFTHVSNKNE